MAEAEPRLVLTPTQALDLHAPSAQKHLCPRNHMVTRGRLSSGTVFIFPTSDCYYRRAAAHSALSLEEPAALQALSPIQVSSPGPPHHLSPPAGDTDGHECITSVPWREHPLGRSGARRGWELPMSWGPCGHWRELPHSTLSLLVSRLKLPTPQGSPSPHPAVQGATGLGGVISTPWASESGCGV